jgi:NAD(P)-dependent dehydrogenase (short-subunit alcohol dehydrogenase family)
MRSIASLLDLSGRVAVITGGLGHLGLAVGATFAELGARVVLVDRTETPADPAAFDALRRATSGQVERVVCDLTDETQARETVGRISAAHPAIDILVNNAAFVGSSASTGWVTAFETQDVQLWRKALEINLTAPFVLVQALLPSLRRAKSPSIINVASIYGLVGPQMSIYRDTGLGNPAAYAASKGGLIQFTRYLATTLAPNIRVNAFCPGGIERGQSPSFIERYAERTPLGRMATLEDFKGVAAFLASDLSAYMTGQVIAVDGGWTAW